MITVPYHVAASTIREYVCSACWGELDYIQDPNDPNSTTVFCRECGEATPGFISIRYVEHLQEINEYELVLARLALRDALPWLNPHPARGLTTDQLIHQLGF